MPERIKTSLPKRCRKLGHLVRQLKVSDRALYNKERVQLSLKPSSFPHVNGIDSTILTQLRTDSRLSSFSQ